VDAYLEKVRTVTAEDVRRVARRYFVEDARTVGILIPTPPQHEAATMPGGAVVSEKPQ
jgi:zinc protease